MDAVNCLPKGKEKGDFFDRESTAATEYFNDKVFRGVIILWDLHNPRPHSRRLLIAITRAITI